MYQLFFFTLVILIATGCGNNNSNTDTDIVYDRGAKESIGYLSDATVRIYALDQEQQTLLFEEKTSSGTTLEEIGNFDPHLRDMQRDTQYLYEVSGGKNWDSDHNGIKDNSPVPNTKIYRSIYQGYRQQVAWWSVKTNGNNMAPSE